MIQAFPEEYMTIKAVIYEADEGGYWAKVPSLPGLYTQGDTIEELEANIREAVQLYLSDDRVLDGEDGAHNGRVLEIAV
jgi:predicted RNase H-like HicB family nuclease